MTLGIDTVFVDVEIEGVGEYAVGGISRVGFDVETHWNLERSRPLEAGEVRIHPVTLRRLFGAIDLLQAFVSDIAQGEVNSRRVSIHLRDASRQNDVMRLVFQGCGLISYQAFDIANPTFTLKDSTFHELTFQCSEIETVEIHRPPSPPGLQPTAVIEDVELVELSVGSFGGGATLFGDNLQQPFTSVAPVTLADIRGGHLDRLGRLIERFLSTPQPWAALELRALDGDELVSIGRLRDLIPTRVSFLNPLRVPDNGRMSLDLTLVGHPEP